MKNCWHTNPGLFLSPPADFADSSGKHHRLPLGVDMLAPWSYQTYIFLHWMLKEMMIVSSRICLDQVEQFDLGFRYGQYGNESYMIWGHIDLVCGLNCSIQTEEHSGSDNLFLSLPSCLAWVILHASYSHEGSIKFSSKIRRCCPSGFWVSSMKTNCSEQRGCTAWNPTEKPNSLSKVP